MEDFACTAIRAEAHNPKTLFLITSKGLAADSLCLAVAAALQRKVGSRPCSCLACSHPRSSPATTAGTRPGRSHTCWQLNPTDVIASMASAAALHAPLLPARKERNRVSTTSLPGAYEHLEHQARSGHSGGGYAHTTSWPSWYSTTCPCCAHFGAVHAQMYVSSTKRKALAALEAAGSMSPHLQALLTFNHLAASLHALHSRDASFKRMKRIMRKYGRRYTTLVAFLPADASAGRHTASGHTSWGGHGGKQDIATHMYWSVLPHCMLAGASQAALREFCKLVGQMQQCLAAALDTSLLAGQAQQPHSIRQQKGPLILYTVPCSSQ